MKWSLDNSQFKTLPKLLYSETKPTPVKAPELLLFNTELAKELNLGEYDKNTDLSILAGNETPPNTNVISQAYSGHQFGHYTRLGDGRAHLLGEALTKNSRHRFDLQLKGSGPTPYSRSGDGRATLGPMLREYIVSEAMSSLGVPTTRSLSLIESGETVYREKALPGAVLLRVAKSHLRVGSFEYASSLNDLDVLISLEDYTRKRHFPEAQNSLELLKSVSDLQAKLIAQWMSLGFIHGVMNTDNMSIPGETIDYGPCAFLDEYKPLQVFSYIDQNGRYAFGRQAQIALWNLSRFAECLLPLIDKNKESAIKKAETTLANFSKTFQQKWLYYMSEKLGLAEHSDKKKLNCIQELLSLMEQHKADFTKTFRLLSEEEEEDSLLFKSPSFKDWKKNWLKLVDPQKSYERMRKANPFLIPRNHVLEEALTEAVDKGSYTKVHRLLKALKNPYKHQEEYIDLSHAPKDSQKIQYTFCGT